MDWYLDVARPDAVAELRREIVAFLERHASGPAGIDESELAVAELLANVARHAPGPAWVSVAWATAHPVLTVCDLGPGFVLDPRLPEDPTADSGRGLFIASMLGRDLEVMVRASGGARFSVELPVTRALSESHDPSRRSYHGLPALDEAIPGVGFGKESFLRALVVQLAQVIETEHGPAAAEAAIAQVGADVGRQMEAEFRAAAGIVSTMSPAQMAECYVRLKHAIDGGFYVIECTPSRIVLGNTRCPFGDAVRQAPALCRMTSSVFGGIAAHNSAHDAAVVLEERIAVGDPVCRVVIYLDREPDDPRVAHRYRRPTPS